MQNNVALVENTAEDDFHLPVRELTAQVHTSTALNNDFWDMWTQRQLMPEQIAIFARNYGEFSRAFPEVLAIIISITRDVLARTEYTKTLHSEMGYGNPNRVHQVLLDGFYYELGKNIGAPETLLWVNIEKNYDIIPSTTALVEGEKRLYGGDNATAAGAQLALEWQAYTMVRKLYDGACQYKSHWKIEDEFHEACEYFYAHIGATEKEHRIESLNGAMQYHESEESLERIKFGFHEHLKIFGEFWNGIAQEMKKLEA